MENWGLVSFREDRIMFNEHIASILHKQQLGETMAHEIAHFCKLALPMRSRTSLCDAQGSATMSRANGGITYG